MKKEFLEGTELFDASQLYPLSRYDILNEYLSLESLYARVFKTYTRFPVSVHGLKKEAVGENYKPKNCLESLYESNYICDYEHFRGEITLETIIRQQIHRGIGIIEISGPKGSGKSLLCIEIAKSSLGNVLYIDTCGSLDNRRFLGLPSLIPLRIFNCEELMLVIRDFEARVKADDVLLPYCGFSARSVGTLIVDSTWLVGQIDTLKKRQAYFLDLYVILRCISWAYNISVIVCSSGKGEPKPLGRDPKNGMRSILNYKWRMHCYSNITLGYKLFFIRDKMCIGDRESDNNKVIQGSIIKHSTTNDSSSINVAYSDSSSIFVERVMSIKTGSGFSNQSSRFSISDYHIVLQDL